MLGTTLTDVCAEIKNYFVANSSDIMIGDFTITDGAFVPVINFPTKYIRIVGSHLNDGVHILDDGDLKDESFHGAVWIMSPSKNFLLLCEEIESWQSENGKVGSQAMSPFTSESFGGYSYSKGMVGASAMGWQNVYGNRLNQYRKIRTL